ncbi:hypothetical protein [Fodinibius sediminis]|uniref:Uncharacterized protein n=1 Tax=Fodinibius sediminis TaxID=1214077 RepID=A0A521E7D6_9BACT|nr:hypothetical protein [Fodinibius sediminis]SMO79321.1 hypothetical protein SAMN06265218_113115 [Fodinibius sediminis]
MTTTMNLYVAHFRRLNCKRILAAALLFILFFYSCESSEVAERRFLTEDNFATLKPEITEVNEHGATFRLRMPFDKYPFVQNYGFSITSRDGRRMVEFSDQLNRSTFDTTMTTDLICGLRYRVSAFVEVEDEEYYSKSQVFVSRGSANTKPWCGKEIVSKPSLGFDQTFGVIVNNTPHFIYQSGQFYSYDILNASLNELPSFQGGGGTTGRHYVAFSIDNIAYFASDETLSYRYDAISEEWELFGTITVPAYRGGDMFGAAIQNTGYYFSSRYSYSFDPLTGESTKLADYNLNTFINSFHTDDAIYAVTENFHILRFNEVTGGWTKVAAYPGNKSDWIVTFVHDEKAYLGLSYRYHSPGKVAYYDLWALDLQSYEWQELPPFPYEYELEFTHNITALSSKGSFFMFYDINADANSFVWTIDASELAKD